MNADEWNEIRRCHSRGESIKGIAQRLGMSRNTVRRALALTDPPVDHRSRSGSIADTVDTRLREILIDAPDTSIAELSRQTGWDRSRTTLARRVNVIRGELAVTGGADDRPIPVIPGFATSFVGRREELRTLRTMLGENVLVTITGPGGMGKTRLAVQAASDFRRAFPDGVRVIELAAVRSPNLLTQAVCDSLAISHRDVHGRSAEETLIDYLRNRRMLLVLDNCEHLLDECARLVTALLTSTRQLRIVATSREVLAVPGEYVFPLPPLSTFDDTVSSGAVELFVNRASSVLSGFELDDGNREAVRRICSRLDGLPLAIELACARLPVLSVNELADRLDRRLDLLTVGNRTGPQRHRSLQATVDWSYELCTREQQLLWAHASIFAGGFDLGMAENVCSDLELPVESILDGVSALVGKSILHREETSGVVRFRMLETIREYGNSKLDAKAKADLQFRLLHWCGDLVSRAVDDWFGPDQRPAAEQVRLNHANIRSVLHTAISHPTGDSGQLAADILGKAWFLWACGLSVREHRMWLTRVLDMPDVSPWSRGRVLATLGLVQTLQGDRDSAEFVLHRAVTISDDAGDDQNVAFATQVRGLKEFFAGQFDIARTLMVDAQERYRAVGGRPDLVHTLHIHRGMLCCFTSDIDEAFEHFSIVRRRSEEIGEWWLRSYATYGLGLVALMRQDFDSAAELAVRSLSMKQDFDDVVGTTLVTDLLGWSEAERGSAERSVVLLGAAASMWGSFGMQLYGSQHWVDKRASTEDQCRKALGSNRFDTCHHKGEAMSVAELIGYALNEEPVTAQTGQRVDTVHEMLSPREREVAVYVAAGMTNKEIAAKMVLSSRTVEGHVEHILGKLGIDRRSEVAAMIEPVRVG
jgi:predicted ATPase/DNA-binding CsgD family transcriptional regulator